MELTPGLEPGGYLEAVLNHGCPAYAGLALLSLGAALAAVWLSKPNRDLKEKEQEEREQRETHQEHPTGPAAPREHLTSGDTTTDEAVEKDSSSSDGVISSFEISPDDECEFVPLSAEADQPLVPLTRYIPLDPDSPTRQVKEYLARRRGQAEESGGAELTREDFAKYLSPKDLHVLDDPRESPSRKGSLISRVKKARQRALRNAVERDMSAEDKIKESMASSQMLARVYTIMRENKELFGETNFEDVKSQMDLYQA